MGDRWHINFQKLNNYIEYHDKLPSLLNPNEEIKKMTRWLYRQNKVFDKNIANHENGVVWLQFKKKYEHLFLDNYDKWNNMFNKLHNFIIENNDLPPFKTSNKDIKKINNWMNSQMKAYKNQNSVTFLTIESNMSK